MGGVRKPRFARGGAAPLPAKAEGLRRWPGAERLIGEGRVRLVRQGVNHVKVVVEQGARTAAKGYAGMWAGPYE